jgi:AMP-binding enzyme
MKDDASPRPLSRTLGDLVDEMAARRPTGETIVFRDERLDYAALKTRVDAFARSLLALGVQRGDRVALLATNRPEWIICALAATKIGAIVAAISTFSTARELAWCWNTAVPWHFTLEAFRGRRFSRRCAVCGPELGDAQPGAQLPSLRTVVPVDTAPDREAARLILPRGRGNIFFTDEQFRYDARSGEARVGLPPLLRFARRGCYALGASERDCPFRGRDPGFRPTESRGRHDVLSRVQRPSAVRISDRRCLLPRCGNRGQPVRAAASISQRIRTEPDRVALITGRAN